MTYHVFAGILKNAPAPKLPEGFFDDEIKDTSLPEPTSVVASSSKEEETPMEADEEVIDSKDPLPEGFFDDPVMDAKVISFIYFRNINRLG